MVRYTALKNQLNRLGSRMVLALGCEVRFINGHTQDVIDRILSGQFPTLNGTKYILTEFLPIVDMAYVISVIQQLRMAGFLPVIAHAERYPRVFGNAERAREIHKSALIQINAYSPGG